MEKEKEENSCCYFSFNYFSLSLLILACIFIFIQSIINVIYNSNNKTSIAERLVYQQFSHEVYSNIKSKILYDFEIINYYDNCSDEREILNIPIKIESYYDCEKVKDDELDNDFCQNKITRSSICCKKECCKTDIYTNQKTCRNKNIYNSNDIFDEPRKNCKLFNIYNGKIYKIDYYKICARKYEYDYEYLLEMNQNSFCPDGITLDSLDHCLNDNIIIQNQSDSNVFLFFKNSSVIVKNILSEMNPNYFEYELLLSESILNNKIKAYENEQNEVNRYKTINIKNIYNAFFKNVNNFDNIDGNQYYINHFSIYLRHLIDSSDDTVLNQFRDDNFIKEKNLNWYTRNYIGFKDIDELQKFKYYFDKDDPTNNPLYRMDKILFPNLESIIISIVFLFFLILILICQIYYKIKKEKKEETNFYFDSFRRFSTLVLLIIYLSIYLFKYLYYYYKIEEIEMEKYYKIVLEKYNKRRKQIYLLVGVILLKINLIIEIIRYIIEITKEINKEGINFPSEYTIICELKSSYLEKKQIKFKFYLERTFIEEKERFEKKFFDNYEIIECNINNQIIDENKKISELGLTSESIIEVICEPIEMEKEMENEEENFIRNEIENKKENEMENEIKNDNEIKNEVEKENEKVNEKEKEKKNENENEMEDDINEIDINNQILNI